MTHLDLFSGIGGFAIAAQACGFRTVAFCEIEPYAQQVLKEKFGAVMADSATKRCGWRSHNQGQETTERDRVATVLHPDIFALNGADYLGVDLVTGGFPCQPYSCAGKRRGSEDHRAIWPEMRRIIAEARPAWVLGENVPGIINMELDRVLSDLEAIGYACWPLVVPACAVDARHRRDRVWIVGYRNDPIRTMESEGSICDKRGWIGNTSKNVSNDMYGRLENRAHQPSQTRTENPAGIGTRAPVCCENGAMWLPEPDVGRVAHGIPARAHRLRALGNAIVPQVAEVIIREIARLINQDFPVRIETNKPNSL